jgi:hypothetical protein
MASDSEVLHKQGAIIAFLTAKEETVGDIHKHPKSVYADCTVGRWAKRVRSSERGNTNLEDEPCSSQQETEALVSRWRKAVEKDGNYMEK